MIRLITAGESHGRALTAIIEGLPAHLKVDKEKIDDALRLRQSGFGRSARQNIECDRAEILSGVRNGETLASPLAICIFNRDYENWRKVMSADVGECDEAAMREKALTKVRPGHADLAGALKFSQVDARNVLERASARESAIRVAAGEILRGYLSELGVEIGGFVKSVYDVKDGGRYAFTDLERAKTSPVGMLDKRAEEEAIKRISVLKEEGDTAGGVAEIRVKGLKSGFGSPMTYAEKLDGRLAQALMSIQGVKGVEVGDGFESASKRGSLAHDEIEYIGDGNGVNGANGGFRRKTNHAGGIEGGMSNGEEILLRVAMKPIPTLGKGLSTVDIIDKKAAVAAYERSDVCAIFALERIAEAAVAICLAEVVSERLGGDTMDEVKARYATL